MAFEDDAQINESMDASMVDAPGGTEEQIDTESSFREQLGNDTALPKDDGHKTPSM